MKKLANKKLKENEIRFREVYEIVIIYYLVKKNIHNHIHIFDYQFFSRNIVKFACEDYFD